MPLILLTRPEEAARRLEQVLREALGEATVLISPLLSIRYGGALPDGVFVPVFTSRHGVAGYARAGGQADGPCWCVGDATAVAAEQLGLSPRSARGDAEALVKDILQSGETGPFLHIRGRHARGDVAGALRAGGRTAREAVLYDQVARSLSDEARAALSAGVSGGKPVVLPLFSPRSARIFSEEVAGLSATAPLFIVAMSAAVAEAAQDVQAEDIRIAARPDAGAMVEAIAGAYAAARALEGAAGAT